MRRIFLVFGLVASSTTPAFPIDESTPPTAGGAINGDTLFVGIIAPGSSSGYVSAGNAPSPYTYTWLPFENAFEPDDPFCDAGDGRLGTPGTLITRDLSGAIVNMELRCAGPGEDPVPQPPTIAEIWDAALRDIPGPRPGINPRPTGLTGLETWLWYDGPREVAISAGVRGWTVTGTARVVAVTFDVGDGQEATSATGGSEAEPAARYVYETKGGYDVVVTARWEADVVLAGPGLPGGRPTPIGTAVLRGTERYPVQEVRGLLVKE